jgi:hypothetical protein
MLRYFPDIAGGLTEGPDETPVHPDQTDDAFNEQLGAARDKTVERAAETAAPAEERDTSDPEAPFSIRETFGTPDEQASSDRTIESGLTRAGDPVSVDPQVAAKAWLAEKDADPVWRAQLDADAAAGEQMAATERAERAELQMARDSARIEAAGQQLWETGEPGIVLAGLLQDLNAGAISEAAYDNFSRLLITPQEDGGWGFAEEEGFAAQQAAIQYLRAVSDQRAAEQAQTDHLNRSLAMGENQDRVVAAFAHAKGITTQAELDARTTAAQRALESQYPGASLASIENPDEFADALTYFDAVAEEAHSAATQQVFKEMAFGASSPPSTNIGDGIERYNPLTGGFERVNTIPIPDARVDPARVKARMLERPQEMSTAQFKKTMLSEDQKRADIADLVKTIRESDPVTVARDASIRAAFGG